MTTYRKFDRFRAHSAFFTDEDAFNAYVANKWISSGTGTPANAQGTNGGLNLVTSAAIADSAIIQRGIETAATKLANTPIRQYKKFSLVARFEHADFANIEVNFGLGPAQANPFTGTGSLYASLKSDNTYTFNFGARTFTGTLPRALSGYRDTFGGINLEIYFDGEAKSGFFLNGQRMGGFRGLTFDSVTGLTTDLPNPLSLSAGIVTRSATAKTVLLRRIASALQIAPYPRSA